MGNPSFYNVWFSALRIAKPQVFVNDALLRAIFVIVPQKAYTEPNMVALYGRTTASWL